MSANNRNPARATTPSRKTKATGRSSVGVGAEEAININNVVTRLQVNIITIIGEEGVVSNNSSTKISSSNRSLDPVAPNEARFNIKNRYNHNSSSSTRISSRFSNNLISSKGKVGDAQITLTTILGASSTREIMQTATASNSKDRQIKATTKRQ